MGRELLLTATMLGLCLKILILIRKLNLSFRNWSCYLIRLLLHSLQTLLQCTIAPFEWKKQSEKAEGPL